MWAVQRYENSAGTPEEQRWVPAPRPDLTPASDGRREEKVRRSEILSALPTGDADVDRSRAAAVVADELEGGEARGTSLQWV